MYTTAQINAIISRCPVEQIDKLIDSYVHSARNREIAKRKILDNIPYEPLSEKHNLSPRQCFNIVRDVKRIIVQHIQI